VRLGTNGCTPDEPMQVIFTGEAADRQHIGSLMKVLAGLAMKNVKDFEFFLEEKISDITLSDVIIITSFLSKNLCEQIRILEEADNAVGVILLEEVYEAGVLPGDIDIYVLSEEYNKNRPSGNDYGMVKASDDGKRKEDTERKKKVGSEGNIIVKNDGKVNNLNGDKPSDANGDIANKIGGSKASGENI
jgi:hypothetical protein